TEYSADGDVSKKYTNKLGQNYKVSTKAFGQGQFVSQETQYDVLGRKLKESQPYFEGQSANQWDVIAYDDSVFPPKATTTSFTGKQLETSVSGNTSTVKELNGYNRTNSKTTDALGNVISTTDKGGTIQFSYNASGEQIKAKYAENIVTFKYDHWGRKSELDDPSNGLYKYEYDGFGQPKKTISPKGIKEFTYNNLGQLISHTEISTTDGGQATNKVIAYTYDNKGRLTSKSGTSKGKSYSSNVIYDPQGRVLSSSESSNGKYFIQKGVTYDDKARIISYEKQLYSSGLLTKIQIENIYSAWNGELYQIKDKNSGKVLWEIQETNAKGMVVKAKLGAAVVNNTYDANGFLTNMNHSSAVKPSILQISYSFDAIKNELKSRTTGGDFNIAESFDYDDNNRLVNWTNPVTGIKPANNRNIYDIKGRITQNDQVGTIKFENAAKVYQPTGMTLNAEGTQNYNNDLIQSIAYNENNDPVFIDGEKGDVAFQYGLTSMRQKVSYGGNFDPDQEGKFTKFYNEDGSFEIIKDNITGKEKHVLYLGGTPYESNIVYLKNFTEDNGSYKFLHKDYVGSILSISDEAGNKLEQRHFDAWGNFTHLQIGNGAIITDKNIINSTALLLERGYTSHEHFAEVGIIHMNGRLYDPLLRRFLNADENIQDPTNTQNYNKYGYVLNNPLIFNDPSGEVLPFLIGVGLGYFWAAVISGAIIGAAISVGMYALQATLNNNWSWGGFAKSLLMGTVTGAVSAGLGEVFSAGGFWATVGNGALTGAGSGSVVSLINGDNFLEGLIKGAVIGGGVAAVSYSVNYLVKYAGMKDQFKYYDESNGTIGDGKALDYSNKTLQEMRSKNYLPEEMQRFRVDGDVIGSEQYAQTSNGFFSTTNGNAYAYTTRPNFLTGKSTIHYARASFASKELLFTTMAHETA
ncbi:MAG: type IV secretion protein Rhs, partial [Chryseobacterium sp.]|nr:type IV secretion protein Rhs [Chryseobacterium sp.]